MTHRRRPGAIQNPSGFARRSNAKGGVRKVRTMLQADRKGVLRCKFISDRAVPSDPGLTDKPSHRAEAGRPCRRREPRVKRGLPSFLFVLFFSRHVQAVYQVRCRLAQEPRVGDVQDPNSPSDRRKLSQNVLHHRVRSRFFATHPLSTTYARFPTRQTAARHVRGNQAQENWWLRRLLSSRL